MAPDALHLAGFEHAQQLGLHRERQLADLVEEDGAAVGQLEEAGCRFGGAGVGPLDVAEELAFEERLDDGGAVDDHEGLLAAWARAIERAGHELLAAAGLAGDERGADVRRQAPDEIEELLRRRPAADHAAELRALCRAALGLEQHARGG